VKATGEAREPKVADADFNEELYLTLHPDVAKAVGQGLLVSGKEHFLKYGKAEGRRIC
jgi:hypothetical protein